MRIELVTAAVFFLAASSIAAPPASDHAVSPALLQQTLETSKRRSQLEMDGAPPFHLIASFKWLSSKGHWGNGTLDELWKDPHHYRHALAFDGRKLVETDNGIQAWRTGEWSLPFAHGLDEALRPFLYSQSDDRLGVGAPPNGTTNLDCIGTEPDLPGVAPDVPLAETTYCMDPGSHLLRVISRPNNIALTFNDIQTFGIKKYIARSIEVTQLGVPIFSLHIDSITKPTDFAILDIPPPPDAQLLPFHRADIPFRTGETMLGQVIYAPANTMPHAGLAGTVYLKAHIDTTGAVTSVTVIKSPNDFLTAAAISSVKNWKFRVSYQFDKPISVDQSIAFRVGPDYDNLP